MFSLKKIILTTVSCLALSACSSFIEDMDGLFLQEGAARHDARISNDAEKAGSLPIVSSDMAQVMSNGYVQVYDLGVPVAAAPSVASFVSPPAPVSSVLPSSFYSLSREGGVPSSVDSNVIVYPFDTQLASPRRQERRVPLVPPSEQYRPLQSPFGGPIQTAVPLGSPSSVPSLMTPLSMPVPFEPSKPAAANVTSRIYYRHGSAHLDQTGRRVVEFVGHKGKAGAISVEGHASERAEVDDPVERSIVNLEMSLERAFKVSSALIRSGVPADTIETKAYGATRPAAALDGATQESSNRRVEIRTELGEGLNAGGKKIPDLLRY